MICLTAGCETPLLGLAEEAFGACARCRQKKLMRLTHTLDQLQAKIDDPDTPPLSGKPSTDGHGNR